MPLNLKKRKKTIKFVKNADKVIKKDQKRQTRGSGVK